MENALLAVLSRRNLLRQAGVAGLATFTSSSWAQSVVNLPLPGGVDERQITTSFPQKGRMILQRTRPPLLETPFEVFDKGVFTPNDEFFVRWHWAVIPTSVDVREFRLNVHGHVDRPLSLTLKEVLALPQVEYAAVNQCSGNSRGFFQPRVPGGEWESAILRCLARDPGQRFRRASDVAGALMLKLAMADQKAPCRCASTAWMRRWARMGRTS